MELPTHWLNSENIENSNCPVTQEILLKGLANPAQWALYGGDYGNHRHSPITAFKIFTGNRRGYALSLDSRTAEVLWRFKMGGGVCCQRVVYQVNGKSHMAMGSGNSNSFAAFAEFAGGPDNIPEGGHLFVFALK